MLNRTTNETIDTVLVGDFNFNHISPNATTKHFLLTMNLLNLKLLINEPTSITQTSKTLTELTAFVTLPKLYVSGILPIDFPDHSAMLGVRKLHSPSLNHRKWLTSLIINTISPLCFCDDLKNLPWDILGLEQTPNEAWLSFKDIFLTAADKRTPIVIRRVRGRYVPWLTPEIKDLIHKCNYEHKKATSTRAIHESIYKTSRNSVNIKMRKENCNCSINKLSGDKNSKDIWRLWTGSCLQKRNEQSTFAH